MVYVSVLFVTAFGAAEGAWSKRAQPLGGAQLVGLSAPGGADVLVAGYRMEQSGLFPVFRPEVARSSNAAQSFTEISGSLDDSATISSIPSAIFFLGADTGWVAVGDTVYRTVDGGGTWSGASAGATLWALHFFDAARGIAVGVDGAILRSADGGASWTAVSSPVGHDLTHLFFVSDTLGWAAGHVTAPRDDGSGGTFDAPSEAVVLGSADGGASWFLLERLPGRGAGPLFFLGDGRTGWLAAYDQVDANRAHAYLYRSVDAGSTFSEVALPRQVGTMSMMGFSSPIETSHIGAMHWQDSLRGRLAGSAFVVELTQSGGGGGTSSEVWRTVDYFTSDGGSTWTRSDLGVVTVSLSQPPPSDGLIVGGKLTDLYNGWLAAGPWVWDFQATCAGASDCGDGYLCDAGRCTVASAGGGGGDGGGDAGGGSGTGGGTSRPGTSGDAEGGCAAGGVRLAAALAAGALVRRRRLTARQE